MGSVSLTPKPATPAHLGTAAGHGIEKYTWALGILLVIATVALYYPVSGHPFVNYDDNVYVTENEQVKSGLNWDTLQWAFTTTEAGNWHPLTWLSHTLDYQLFQADPAGHHNTNLLLHVLNALLLFWVLRQATGFTGRSWMVAALFALHPVNVESVAWISERKNLLSMLFFLLALGAYRWYVREPRTGRYAVVAGFFALGLMAKPQIITLPFVLLLWDYWPLRRMAIVGDQAAFDTADDRPALAKNALEQSALPQQSFSWLAAEKLPLLALCGASAFITMRAQQAAGAMHTVKNTFPLSIRLGNAIVCYARYLGKAFWPSHLALVYPHPGTSLKAWAVFAALVLLLAVTALVLSERRRRYLLVGWFWFLGTMVPMIGLVQVGEQAMADRYAYLPFIGLFIMVCWGLADWAEQRKVPAAVLAGASIVVLTALSVVAYRQLNYWGDNVVLWTHIIEVTPANYIAQDDLGGAYLNSGQLEEAMQHFRAAAEIYPLDPFSNLNLAIYAQQHNDPQQAIARSNIVLTRTPSPRLRSKAYTTMGLAYRALGNQEESRKCLEAAQRESP
ncbi:MAG: tetratricopeptide repeat protein [Candidatus Korobacteraceae bacterium]